MKERKKREKKRERNQTIKRVQSKQGETWRNLPKDKFNYRRILTREMPNNGIINEKINKYDSPCADAKWKMMQRSVEKRWSRRKAVVEQN